jgi:FlaA1/EpsC-like NDP-sugar epimerase
MIHNINTLPRSYKRSLLLLSDCIVLIVAIALSLSIRHGELYVMQGREYLLLFIAPFIAMPIFIGFGLYRNIIRYIGLDALWHIVQAVSVYILIWGISVFLLEIEGFPRSVVIINWLLLILFLSSTRLIARQLFLPNSYKNSKNVVIYGAGEAGIQLLSALSDSIEFNPVAFLDDNYELQKQNIKGIKIYAPQNLLKLIEKKKIVEIFIALPSLSRSKRKIIIKSLESYPILIKTLPGVSELAAGKVQLKDLRKISINDLLSRDKVEPNEELLGINITDKVVMVTGSGGSIGSELCRQIIKLKPKKLVLFEQSEFALYTVEQELLKDDVEVICVLGSVTKQKLVERTCNKLGVQTIYHAAAYKHVPMVEFNSSEGVFNNIFGTLYCVKAAIATGVENFILISTDKAVRPTNMMGASKRVAEMILQALSETQTKTCLTMVRFGNVLGSSGSVIPFFLKQIENGGPITVTDPRIIRYFMTIPEASQLVIQAGTMGNGGDVFVLDMGEPVLILELAKKMIRLSGLEIKDNENSKGDIEIVFTGLRPGEKLYEELLIGDNVSKTDNPMIMRANEDLIKWQELEKIITELNVAIENFDYQKIRTLIIQIVPEFKPQSSISDVLQ